MARPFAVDPLVLAHERGAARTRRVIAGLIASGRACPAALGDDDAEFIRLPRQRGGWYWVSRDGIEVRAGLNFVDAEPMSAGFVARMARDGATEKI